MNGVVCCRSVSGLDKEADLVHMEAYTSDGRKTFVIFFVWVSVITIFFPGFLLTFSPSFVMFFTFSLFSCLLQPFALSSHAKFMNKNKEKKTILLHFNTHTHTEQFHPHTFLTFSNFTPYKNYIIYYLILY